MSEEEKNDTCENITLIDAIEGLIKHARAVSNIFNEDADESEPCGCDCKCHKHDAGLPERANDVQPKELKKKRDVRIKIRGLPRVILDSMKVDINDVKDHDGTVVTNISLNF